MSYLYRKAVPDDAVICFDLRGRTRENAFSPEQLKAIGVTVDSWSSGIRDDTLPGYICTYLDTTVGYCFGDRETGEIVVLAVLPNHENRGVGKTLLSKMIDEFRSIGFKRLYLGCSTNPNVRSFAFYRYLGWQPTGIRDSLGDEILELYLT